MEDDQGQQGDAPVDPTVWTPGSAPTTPPAPAPPEAPTFAPGTPPWARAGGGVPPVPGVVNPGAGPGAQPWGSPAASSPGVPPNPMNPSGPLTQNPAGWSAPSAVPVPGAPPTGFPSTVAPFGTAVPLAPGVPSPYAAPTRSRIERIGIHPLLGLSVIIQGFPALLFVAYGTLGLFASVLIERNREIGSSSFDTSDFSKAAGIAGLVVLLIGVAGLASVVMMAHGNNAARMVCTIWLGLDLVLIVISAVSSASSDSSGFSFLGGVFAFVPPLVALFGMWTPKSSEIF